MTTLLNSATRSLAGVSPPTLHLPRGTQLLDVLLNENFRIAHEPEPVGNLHYCQGRRLSEDSHGATHRENFADRERGRRSGCVSVLRWAAGAAEIGRAHV